MILRPNIYIKSIKDLNIKKIKNLGIRVLIIDIDNTLVPSDTKKINDEAIFFVKKLKENQIIPVIISNNINKRVSYFGKMLDIDYYAFSLKPLPFRFWQIERKYHINRHEVMIIGDQLMTDILFAKTSRINSILVDPIINKDNIFGKVTRSIENIIRKIDKFEKGAYYDQM